MKREVKGGTPLYLFPSFVRREEGEGRERF